MTTNDYSVRDDAASHSTLLRYVFTSIDDPVNRNSIVTVFLTTLLMFAVTWFFGFKFLFTKKQLSEVFRYLGVAARKVAKVVKEVRRKTFHLLGLVIPAIYYFGLKYVPGFNKKVAVMIMGGCTEFYWVLELLRVLFPAFRVKFNQAFSKVLRQKEQDRITGMGFYLLGNFLIISLFPELATITSMLYLILGDLVAALVGISFGRIKILGKKSLQGTIAMFVTCYIISVVMFWKLPFFEYIAFVGSATATVVELLDPFDLDDNFSIPVSAALAIQLVTWRINVMVHHANLSPTWVNLSLNNST